MINLSYPDEKDDYYNDPKTFLSELVPDGPNVVGYNQKVWKKQIKAAYPFW